MPTDETFADVLAANADYAQSFGLADLPGKATRGLAVLTCMDARIDPMRILGLRDGEAAVLRNGGARIDEGVIAMLVVARHLLDVDRVAVLAHTKCRMTASSPDEIHEQIRAAGGPDTSGLTFMPTPDPAAGVCDDVELARASKLLSGLQLGGFVYDVETGKIKQVC